jgi:hypothetical protein
LECNGLRGEYKQSTVEHEQSTKQVGPLSYSARTPLVLGVQGKYALPESRLSPLVYGLTFTYDRETEEISYLLNFQRTEIRIWYHFNTTHLIYIEGLSTSTSSILPNFATDEKLISSRIAVYVI